MLSKTYPYHSPVNPTGVSGFQPTGGAFITLPISPKIIKPEAVKVCETQFASHYIINNSNGNSENERHIFSSAISNTLGAKPVMALIKPQAIHSAITHRPITTLSQQPQLALAVLEDASYSIANRQQGTSYISANLNPKIYCNVQIPISGN